MSDVRVSSDYDIIRCVYELHRGLKQGNKNSRRTHAATECTLCSKVRLFNEILTVYMDHKVNVTYITVDGYVEMHKYRYLYFVILLTAYILILCSNSTVVCLIWFHQNLHEPMYIFIAALLINSVVYSTTLYPKLLTDVLSDRQLITYSGCLFQYFVFYALGGSEFLLLAVMAYDRYVSICKPLQYAAVMSRSSVSALLALAWLLPACQVAVPAAMNTSKKLCSLTFKGIICNSTVYKLHCVRSPVLNIYGLMTFASLGLVPVSFILFTYTRILIISSRSSQEVRSKAAHTCLPHLLVLINFTCSIAYDVLLVRLETTFPPTVRFIMTIQIIMYHPLLNPIIYGLKMKEIHKHLKMLFGVMV